MKFNLIGIFGLLFWASSLPFAKYCSEVLGPLTTASIQYMVSGLLGFGILFVRKSTGQQSFDFFRRSQFFIRTFLFTLYFGLLYFAIGSVSRAQLPVVILLNYLWPTCTMLMSIRLFGLRFRPFYLVIGTILVLCGLYVEIVGENFFSLIAWSNERSVIIAYLSAFVAACVWGLYSTLNRRWGVLAGGVEALPAIMLFTSVVLAFFRYFFGEVSDYAPRILLPMAYLCLMPIVGNVCWDIGIRKGNLTLLSLFADGLPWLSLTFTSLCLGVAITNQTWVAAVLIVSGALVTRIGLLLTPRTA